ncbi:hypothetical protein NXV08_00055 (plasmid) [Bacteroides fragilis]|nr:hypothetical protein [Bacteroides fragilis]
MEKNIKVALMDNGLLVTLVLVQYILDVACIGILMNLQKKRFAVYERNGEIGEIGVVREYLEFTPKE